MKLSLKYFQGLVLYQFEQQFLYEVQEQKVVDNSDEMFFDSQT